jgi:hypothetical protein
LREKGVVINLVGVRIENLRGFQNAFFDLTPNPLVLVGPNNSGKTGFLRLLDFVFNHADESLVTGQRPLSFDEQALLLPASAGGGRARRITLHVEIPDRRRHSRFRARDGVADFRFRTVRNHCYVNLGRPSRSDRDEHDRVALSLLEELREEINFRLIPAIRGTTLEGFSEVLQQALTRHMESRAVHRRQGGSPTEYRIVRRALGDIRSTLQDLALPLWDEIQGSILPGMSSEGRFEFGLDAAGLVDWVSRLMNFRLVTGSHDAHGVAAIEVGSGLQSLLHIALLKAVSPPTGTTNLLAIEEPEAYLHPSAQRTLARMLFDNEDAQTIVSTHSPIFVDEAPYSAITIMRGHHVYSPRRVDPIREDINTALLTGSGSEIPFARSVLFVEGEGDRLFFEGLRRRLALVDESGACDRLLVLAVGGKTRFGPWIRLSHSFRDETGSRAVRWLVTADGVDAASHVREGFRGGGMRVPLMIGSRFDSVIGAAGGTDQSTLIAATTQLNETCRKTGFQLHLLPIDLEWCALEVASWRTIRRIAARCALGATNRNELLGELDSKAEAAVSFASPTKQPWIRAIIAEELPDEEISEDAVAVMRRWLVGAVGIVRRANDILRNADWM